MSIIDAGSADFNFSMGRQNQTITLFENNTYMTKENDIVLIYVEDMPVSFARVESILADSKKDWYHVKLLFLQIPMQVVTWILKDTYINGQEFSMGGKKMRLKPVKCPEEKVIDNEKPLPHKISHIEHKQKADMQGAKKKIKNKDKQAKIISLAEMRKLKNKK